MITLEPTSPLPPYEQIRVQLEDLIRSGDLEAGQRLPSIRQLAGDLRIAPGTVARAYSELEAAELIETNRARGTRVLSGNTAAEPLQAAADAFIGSAHAHNVSLDDALSAIRAAWKRAAGH